AMQLKNKSVPNSFNSFREVLRRDGRRVVHFADPPQLVILDPDAVAAQGPEAIVIDLVEIAPELLLLNAGEMGHDLVDLVLRHAVVDHLLIVFVGEGPSPLDLRSEEHT